MLHPLDKPCGVADNPRVFHESTDAAVFNPHGQGRRRGTWYLAAILLVAGWLVASNAATWPSRLHYPGDVDASEGMRVAEMQHLRRGVPVYAPASGERFDAMNYGPLYFWVGARLIDPENISYRPMRIVSFIAMLGYVSGASLLAFWLSRNQWAALLSALFFLSYSFVSSRAVSVRCDVTALALVFWGFLIAYKFRADRRLLCSVPLILLGLFFKQQFVAAPLAVFLFLLLERRFRTAVEFAALLGGGGVALLAYFQFVVFPGQSLLLHLVGYNIVRFSWSRLGFGLLFFGVMFGVPLLLALEFVRRHPDRLLASYLGCSVLGLAIAVAREGSGPGYFLEPLLIIGALMAGLILECRNEVGRHVEILSLVGESFLLGTRLAGLAPTAEDIVLDRNAVKYLRRNFAPGTVGAGRYPGQMLRAGLSVPISDFFLYSWLMCQETIPSAGFVTQLEQRKSGVLLFRQNLADEDSAHPADEMCLKEDVHRAILQNYRLETTLPMPRPDQGDFAPTRFYVWVPRR